MGRRRFGCEMLFLCVFELPGGAVGVRALKETLFRVFHEARECAADHDCVTSAAAPDRAVLATQPACFRQDQGRHRCQLRPHLGPHTARGGALACVMYLALLCAHLLSLHACSHTHTRTNLNLNTRFMQRDRPNLKPKLRPRATRTLTRTKSSVQSQRRAKKKLPRKRKKLRRKRRRRSPSRPLP